MHLAPKIKLWTLPRIGALRFLNKLRGRPEDVPRRPLRAVETPQDGPRTPQEPSWDGLGAILGPSKRKIENKTVQVKFE